MEPDRPLPEAPETLLVMRASWQATLFVSLVTVALGLVVCFHPSGSLNVVAVLAGVLVLLSGLLHLVRMLDRSEEHRVWLGVIGLVLVVVGVVLVRHLNLTKGAIGLLLGIVWIIQGIGAIVAGIQGGSREGRGWWILFGVVSLVGGIVVAAVPVSSLTFLAVLVGVWFVVMGLLQAVAALLLRKEVEHLGR